MIKEVKRIPILVGLLNKYGYPMTPNKDGTYSGPCPFCNGGKDRFTVFPNQGKWGGTCICRKCPPTKEGKLKSYNLVDLIVKLDGKTLNEAIMEVMMLNKTDFMVVGEQTYIAPNKQGNPTIQMFFIGLVVETQKYLSKSKGPLNWLEEKRHLSQDTILGLQLGYVPRSEYIPENLLGFPDNGHKVFIPEGIVIPGKDSYGNIISIDVRRLDGCLPTHYVIRGSIREPEIIKGDGRAIIIVESFLDGALIWQEAKDLCSVGIIYSAQAKATKNFAESLKAYKIVIYAGDTDKAGANGSVYWEREFNAKRKLIPSEYGKDPCEAVDKGLNIRMWVIACLLDYPILYPELQRDCHNDVIESNDREVEQAISLENGTRYLVETSEEIEILPISASGDESVDTAVYFPVLENNYTLVNTPEEVLVAFGVLNKFDWLALDTETYSEATPNNKNDIPALDPRRNKVRLITLTTPDNQTFIFDMKKLGKQVSITKLIHSKYIVGHNLKFDFKSMAVDYGLEIIPKKCFDTMIAEKLIHNATETGKAIKGTYKLSTLCSNNLGITLDKLEQSSDWSKDELTYSQLVYAAKDTKYLLKLQEEQTATLEGIGISSDVIETEMRFTPCLAKIELAGIHVNVAKATEVLEQLIQEYEEAENQWKEQHGGINPNSPKQIGKLFEDEGLDLPDTSKTTLVKYLDNPIVESLITLRSLQHPIKYIQKTLELEDSGKIYPDFEQIAAPTGRMSSSGLNVQAIPSSIKGLYAYPPTGYSIVKCDYPAIELRIAAVVTQEPNLIECFQSGQDPHSLMAAKIKGVSVEEIEKDSTDRKKAKAANFGFLYGMGAKTFMEYAQSYGVSFTQEEAEDFKAEYLEHYQEIDEWQKDTGKALKESESGAIEKVSLAGRVMLADTYCSALNYAVQGTGADMIKASVVKIDEEFTTKGLKARIINVVHDDIRVICPNKEVERVKEILVRIMGSVADKLLPNFKTVPEPEVITSE